MESARSKRASRHPLFAVRAPREVHLRLVAAAKADSLTLGEELTRLLDLREAAEVATRPPHPLARPQPVSRLAVSLPATPANTSEGAST